MQHKTNKPVRILNLLASSSHEHAAVISLHNAITKNLNSHHYSAENVFLTGKKRQDITNSTYWNFNRKSLKGKKLAYFLKRKLLKKLQNQINSYDFIICDGFGVASLLLEIQRKTPTPPCLGVIHSPSLLKPKYRNLLKKNCNKWDVVGVSKIVSDNIRKSKIGFNANSVHTINNAIDFQSIIKGHYEKHEARRILQLEENDFAFGTIGRLVGFKSHITIIEAAGYLKKNNLLPECFKFIIIGDGYLRDKMKRKISENDLNEHFIMLGSIKEASRYVKAFDVFIMTSNEGEGFGIALLEGITAKIPVICSDTPLFKNIIEDENTYFSVGNEIELAKKMLFLFNTNSIKRSKMGTDLYNKSKQKFDINHFNAEYACLISRLIKRYGDN